VVDLVARILQHFIEALLDWHWTRARALSKTIKP
jgi:hypothetical protein